MVWGSWDGRAQRHRATISAVDMWLNLFCSVFSHKLSFLQIQIHVTKSNIFLDFCKRIVIQVIHLWTVKKGPTTLGEHPHATFGSFLVFFWHEVFLRGLFGECGQPHCRQALPPGLLGILPTADPRIPKLPSWKGPEKEPVNIFVVEGILCKKAKGCCGIWGHPARNDTLTPRPGPSHTNPSLRLTQDPSPCACHTLRRLLSSSGLLQAYMIVKFIFFCARLSSSQTVFLNQDHEHHLGTF